MRDLTHALGLLACCAILAFGLATDRQPLVLGLVLDLLK